jgi:two-component system cell cycle sensor histidine kinase/response regulator CckA
MTMEKIDEIVTRNTLGSKSPPPSILIVEDDAALNELLSRRLLRAGFRVGSAYNGEEALSEAGRDGFDILLVDCRLPDMEGKRFIELLAERDLAIPFVIMTGKGDEEIAVEMMKMGAEDYIVKEEGLEERIPSEILSVLADVARKKSEGALRRSEEQFRAFFENCPDYCFIVSGGGIVIDANEEAIDELGFDAGEIIGQRLSILFTEECKGVASRIMAGLPDTGKVKDAELEIRTKSGTGKTIQLNAVACNAENGEITQSIVLMKDMSEHKLLEKQLLFSQKLEAIGELAGGIAHDFNNIITVIRSYSELLMMNEEIPPTLKHDLEEIYEAAGKAATLTRQLLAFGKKQVLRPQPVNLNQLILDLDKMLVRVIGEQIKLSVKLAPGLPQTLADPGQIEQAILNLVLNARDAMPDGGEIVISSEIVHLDEELVHQGRREGDYIVLTVKDTGAGIQGEALPHIFEPFFTTKETGKGTGLGLSVVYGIVSQHNGWIDVRSEPGSGTVFTAYLPVTNEQVAVSDVPPQAMEESLPCGKRILVVEDESSVRNFITKILENNGFTVLQARDGEEAIDLFAGKINEVDLLFSDVVLPGISGLRLAENFRAINPDLKVLFTSGYIDRKSGTDQISERNLFFLAKPYTVNEVMGAIRRIFTAQTSS